ncbi:MAG: hypothetical protein IJQ81_05485 [Oscillibacter sp.]|nr:hypothetical protein [Oscillibacter sp.]
MIERAKHDKNFTVVSNDCIRDMRLSTQGVGMLTKMLSLPNDWNFSIRGLAAICPESYSAVRGMVLELEKNGYVVRRQRRGKLGRWKRIDYIIYEIPRLTEADADKPEETEASTPSMEVSQRETEVLPLPTRPNMAELDAKALNEYRRKIRENVEFDLLWDEHGEDIDDIAKFVEMIAETCAGNSPIRVNGNEIPGQDAKARFLTLNREHILYALECLRKTTSEIRNIRAYTLAALYNAPLTIEQYYEARARKDLK